MRLNLNRRLRIIRRNLKRFLSRKISTRLIISYIGLGVLPLVLVSLILISLTRETLERLAQQVGGINMAQFRQALDTERHKAAVDADMAAAQAAGINGTPGFVINGELISGAVPYEQFEAAVNRALAAH